MNSADGSGMPAGWHVRTVEDSAGELDTDPGCGLTEVEAARRLKLHGPNELREGRRRGPLHILADQFADFMILVLVAAAVISGLLGEIEDTFVIVTIVVLNAVIGFVQEYRAEQAVAALKRMAAQNSTVIRDGVCRAVAARELVPGDVVVLEAGNVVPADLRLADVARLRIAEASLTGESAAVEKTTAPLADPALPAADRVNMAFKGTIATYGRGRGIAVATGMATELGRIAGLLTQQEETRTPLQRRLAGFGKRLAMAILALCLVFFLFGILRGEPLLLMFLTAVSLAVAAIPEALPAVVTISLALGAYQMVQRQALVRRLPAVETLGSVTYICSDKTGTLTENVMRVESVYLDGSTHAPGAGQPQREPWRRFLAGLALCNDARCVKPGEFAGDPTETALLDAAEAAGVSKIALETQSPRIAEIPFDSERKMMTTLHRDGSAVIAYTKGAPESVLPCCVGQLNGAGNAAPDVAAIAAAAERMARDGLRVLAIAYRLWPRLPECVESDAVERDLVFLGLVGLIDPPRPEAAAAVAQCRSAGITPVMITGDHPATARAIALRLGIVDADGQVVTGRELACMDDSGVARAVTSTRVFARVDPQQKILLVAALQARGEFVAMTGDGVNDAPALKRADIGVAMGRTGTDVAREASDMVLLDDNFATIVAAIRSGRRIYDNIRRFVRYALTTNSGEIWTITLAPFLGLPIPLLPIHILWINLVTDGLPGLALTLEPEEKGVMARPPRAPGESIFAGGMWQHILWVGLLMAFLCIGLQFWGQSTGNERWQTMVFTLLTFCQLAHVLAIRSERDSLFTLGLWSNRWLALAVAFTVTLQLAVIYLPFCNRLFKTLPLTAAELAACFALSAIVFVAVEIEKWLVRAGRLYQVRDSAPR